MNLHKSRVDFFGHHFNPCGDIILESILMPKQPLPAAISFMFYCCLMEIPKTIFADVGRRQKLTAVEPKSLIFQRLQDHSFECSRPHTAI